MEEKNKILIEISVGILLVAIGLLGYDIANGKGDQDHIITYWTVVSLAIMIMLSEIALWAYILLQRDKKNINKNKRLKTTRKQIKLLKNLSLKEKKYLKRHIDQDSPTLEYQNSPEEDGTLYGLLSKNILEHPCAGISGVHEYYVSVWAWLYLKNHTELLE